MACAFIAAEPGDQRSDATPSGARCARSACAYSAVVLTADGTSVPSRRAAAPTVPMHNAVIKHLRRLHCSGYDPVAVEIDFSAGFDTVGNRAQSAGCESTVTHARAPPVANRAADASGYATRKTDST
ncbi:hypothetical protein EVC45_28290 [Paraburkholderia sp. UYCP14C]|uniref:hypothetical protein n=1 Tax=Paraburkholderia sp. UYCP14C TaxID=2511130 RepID=UPI001020C6E9|nr:hypothetical protein [Paraburkholderia sp. UYCP14C]RZF26334.1 hypothetical protein EVC45_28290 [Paraburkholderia sp. UYCP14C]